MATLLNTKQKKDIEVFLPNFEEKKFIKEAIDEKIWTLKAKEFFKITEKIRRGLIKNGYSAEQLI